MKHFVLLAGLTALAPAFSNAQEPITIQKVLAGWRCMALARTYGPQGAYAPPAPVYADSATDSPQVGTAMGNIVVPTPTHVANGRTEIVQPSGRRVWVDEKELTVWHSLNDPKARCQPVVLSNGRVGSSVSG